MKGASVKVAILSFSSQRVMTPLHTKNQRSNIPDTFLGVEMYSSPLELGRKKGRVECSWEFQIFYPGIIAQIFEEEYL